jgi:plastocyanin
MKGSIVTMKKLLAAFVVLGLLSALLVACGGSTTGSSSSGSNEGSSSTVTTVHMTSNNFAQPSVTINKGGSINFVDDTSAVHIINNGSWVNGSPQPKTESGAPVVKNLQFNGNDSHTVGPFNTAGTYHLYCTVHQNMNLTVIVK